MNKKILSATFVFVVAMSSLFCKEKIFHAETKFFDIIFDESSRNSAMEISGYADEMLEELCSEYKVEPDFKIPLVITPRTENFNAYFTNYNYNHLVIYDTTPGESMMNYRNTLKSVFTHELTHLVSTNAKNGFWKAVGKIFGDIYNPGNYITMTSFFSEGAAVAKESKNGDGRLNDGFFLHDLRQAKLNGKFPGYTDSFGARTIYPYGSASYLFGSAFTEYIIEKYGMDKYAEFWHRGINSNRLTPVAVFKKTYGLSMKKAWKDFYNSIDVEGLEKDPDEIEGIEKADFENRSLHLYSVLGMKDGEKVILDETTGSIFVGHRKLFTKTGLVTARLSSNGKYIAAIFTDQNHLDVKMRAGFFEIEKGHWKNLEGTGIKQLCIFEKNGKEFIACVKNHSQGSILEIMNMDRDFSLVASLDFSADEIPYSLCGNGNGDIWFLLKEELNFSLCRANFNNLDKQIEINRFRLNSIKPKHLSLCEGNVGKTTLLFSYTEGKSFPRLAMAECKGNELNLSLLEKNISGGIYSPVMNGNKILYAARFYTEGAVYQLNFDFFKSNGFVSTSTISGTTRPATDFAPETNDSFSFSEYKKFLYPGQTIVPLSVLSSYYISPSVYYTNEHDCLGQSSYSYLLGMTVIKNNPWDTRHLSFTAGYSPVKKAGGMGMIFMGKSSGGNMTFTDTVNSIFDKSGLMQINNNFTGSIEFKTGDVSRIILSESNFILYGKDDMNDNAKERYDLKDSQLEKNYLYDKNIVSLLYSTKHKTGARTHEISGISVGMNLKNIFATVDAEKKDSIFNRMIHYEDDRILFSQIYPSAEISIPGILPVDCKGPFTYNIPVTVYGSLFQFNDTFMTFLAQAAIFSWEIQKGMGAVPLYLGTLTLNGIYQQEYTTGLNRNMEIQYLDEDLKNINRMGKNRYAGGSLVLIVGGNTGALANQGINMSVSCRLLHCLDGSHKGETKFLVTSALNFSLF